MIHAIRAELTKTITLPSVKLVPAALAALLAFLIASNMSSVRQDLANITSDGRIELYVGQLVPAEQALTEFVVALPLQVMLFIWVIGAVTAGTEFRSGQIGQSLLTVPPRGRLIVAKAAALTLVSLVVGVLFALIATAGMYFAVRDWDPSFLWSQDVLIGHGSMIFAAIAMNLTALGVTLIARRTLVGVIAMAVFLGIMMTQIVALISPTIDALLPASALRNLMLAGNVTEPVPPLTAGPEHALITLGVWALVSLIVAVIVLRRRDAR